MARIEPRRAARVGSSSYFIDLSIFDRRLAPGAILKGFWRCAQVYSYRPLI